jgi:hypothetical protein
MIVVMIDRSITSVEDQELDHKIEEITKTNLDTKNMKIRTKVNLIHLLMELITKPSTIIETRIAQRNTKMVVKSDKKEVETITAENAIEMVAAQDKIKASPLKTSATTRKKVININKIGMKRGLTQGEREEIVRQLDRTKHLVMVKLREGVAIEEMVNKERNLTWPNS